MVKKLYNSFLKRGKGKCYFENKLWLKSYNKEKGSFKYFLQRLSFSSSQQTLNA